jgi:hypothetical protein
MTGTWELSFVARPEERELIKLAERTIERYATIDRKVSTPTLQSFHVHALGQEDLEQAVMWTSFEIGRAVSLTEAKDPVPRPPWWRRSWR